MQQVRGWDIKGRQGYYQGLRYAVNPFRGTAAAVDVLVTACDCVVRTYLLHHGHEFFFYIYSNAPDQDRFSYEPSVDAPFGYNRVV